MYVYIDESGNLGFSLKSTQFFVVAYLTLEHPFEMGKAMKRQLKRLHKRRKYARGYNELKYSKSRDAVKQKVLRKICQCDVKIGFVVLEKAKVVPQLKENPTILYNYLIVDKVMRAVLPSVDSNDKLNIIVDKSLPRSSREAFNIYARNKASWLLTIWDKEYPIEMSAIEVRHENSQKEPCLQAADFLAGACFCKYERNNDCYYQLFENKVEYFKYLW